MKRGKNVLNELKVVINIILSYYLLIVLPKIDFELLMLLSIGNVSKISTPPFNQSRCIFRFELLWGGEVKSKLCGRQLLFAHWRGFKQITSMGTTSLKIHLFDSHITEIMF